MQAISIWCDDEDRELRIATAGSALTLTVDDGSGPCEVAIGAEDALDLSAAIARMAYRCEREATAAGRRNPDGPEPLDGAGYTVEHFTAGDLSHADLIREAREKGYHEGVQHERERLATAGAEMAATGYNGLPLRQNRKLHERHMAEQAIEACGGNMTRAAAYLGISRTSLYRIVRWQAPTAAEGREIREMEGGAL